MAVNIGSKGLKTCKKGSGNVSAIYKGSTKIWPTKITYTDDYIAFRFYRYGNGGMTPPYEDGSIMAHNWTASGSWYQNMVVFQFTDEFFDKNPTTIYGNNGYYQDDGSGGRVKAGTIYRFSNPNNYDMVQIYNNYTYSSIMNYCTAIVNIPAATQYYNVSVSNFTRGGVYVMKLPDYSSNDGYASSGLAHWNQTKFPCQYNRSGGSTKYNLVAHRNWLASTPSESWFMPQSLNVVFLQSALPIIREVDPSRIRMETFRVSTTEKQTSFNISRRTFDELLNQTEWINSIFIEGEQLRTLDSVITYESDTEMIGCISLMDWVAGINNPEFLLGKYHATGTGVIECRSAINPDVWQFPDVGEDVELPVFIVITPLNSSMGQAILNARMHDGIKDYFA